MSPFHVASEVGRLRRVLLHRPDLELRRLTPSNCEDLLFDDVLWVKRARQEHDVFADTLREAGVEVLYVSELLAETLKDDTARRWLLERVLDDRDLGGALGPPVRAFLGDLDPTALATALIGGVTVDELPAALAAGLHAATLGPRGFVLRPLPNHLFTRDTTCWIYGGVSLNSMAYPARRRETVHMEAIYRFHPIFTEVEFRLWFGGVDQAHGGSTIEGGDVLVVGHGAVVVGMGQRTTAPAVEALAANLFAGGEVQRVVAVELPRRRRFMHLDTLMTMVGPSTVSPIPGWSKDSGHGRSSLVSSVPSPMSSLPSPRPSTSIRCRCSARAATTWKPSASSGTTETTCSPWRPVSSWPTTATSTPTPSCARRAWRSSPSPAASWDVDAAGLGA